MRRLAAFFVLLLPCAAHAGDFHPQEFNIYYSGGRSPMNFHGHSVFRTLHFEVAGGSDLARRWLKADAGIWIAYSDIRQARSWFGYRYGDPDDSVRAVSTNFFVRRSWRPGAAVQPFVDLGTGPMWSNRRVPAATSRFNMDSQLGLGLVLFPTARVPLRVGYRFLHISNGGLTGRNPGLEVSTFFIGMRVATFGAARR